MPNCPNCGFSVVDRSCEVCEWSEHYDYNEDGVTVGCDTVENGQLYCEQCRVNLDEEDWPCPNL